MSTKIKEYNAFISYRHTEPDSEVAIAIHKALESFSLPKNLRDQFPKEKWKINRVFRDQDELPLAEDLSDSITEAIKNSEYLIAVCTPRYPESKWCIREIELFKQIHGQDRILAVLADGEPDASFPKEICFRDEESIDENGNKVIKRVEVEPIAADVRGENKAARKKRIKEETVRLAAAIYGLAYDDVRQRHREQQVRTIATISGICAGVFFLFGMVCMGLSMKINSQKNYIKQQHEELQEKYQEEQIKYAESMAVVSELLLEEGRKKDAVYAIRNTMPSSLEDDSMPYLASTEYALSNALGKYELGAYLPYDVEEVPEDQDFWGNEGIYGPLSYYLDTQSVMYARELSDTKVLLITDQANAYIYYKDANRIMDASMTVFSEAPSGEVKGAVIRDDKMYLWFHNADYVAVYKYAEPDADSYIKEITREEVTGFKGKILYQDDEYITDDGKYKMTVGPNHTVIITDAQNGNILSKLYDIRGSFYRMEKLGNRDRYVIISSGKFSYMLNENFEIIARIPYYYGYEDDGDTIKTYVFDQIDKTFSLYRQKLADYDDLIKEADELIDGYESSEEIKERYKMLK